MRNRLASLETRQAKCKRSLLILREHAQKSTCPIGLQYRPKPHVRLDQEFQTALNRICRNAQSELLALMIRQQEKNLAADNQAIEALQQQQQSMFPDSAQSHSNSTAVSRTTRSKQRPNQKKLSAEHCSHVTSCSNFKGFRNFYLYLRMKL